MTLMLFAGAIHFQWPLKISHAQQIKMPEITPSMVYRAPSLRPACFRTIRKHKLDYLQPHFI